MLIATFNVSFLSCTCKFGVTLISIKKSYLLYVDWFVNISTWTFSSARHASMRLGVNSDVISFHTFHTIKHWNDDYSTYLTLIISPAAGCGALWDGKRWIKLSPSGVCVSWNLCNYVLRHHFYYCSYSGLGLYCEQCECYRYDTSKCGLLRKGMQTWDFSPGSW